jgi:hypothetical protein
VAVTTPVHGVRGWGHTPVRARGHIRCGSAGSDMRDRVEREVRFPRAEVHVSTAFPRRRRMLLRPLRTSRSPKLLRLTTRRRPPASLVRELPLRSSAMDGRCVNESNVILERREWSLADSTACPSLALAVDLILLCRHRDGHADVVVRSVPQGLRAVMLKHSGSLTALPRGSSSVVRLRDGDRIRPALSAPSVPPPSSPRRSRFKMRRPPVHSDRLAAAPERNRPTVAERVGEWLRTGHASS